MAFLPLPVLAPQIPLSFEVDPVCGMDVDPAGPFSAEHDGVRWYFCCEGCRTRFLQPETQSWSSVLGEADKYTCPMCPEVESQVAASCPRCGMALEASVPADDDSATRDVQLRFVVALGGALLIAWLSMGHLLQVPTLASPLNEWLQLAISLPAVWWAGAPWWRVALDSYWSRSLNMFSLLGLGVAMAWLQSTGLLLLGEVATHLQYEAAAWVTTLMIGGQLLEAAARHRTGTAIRELLSHAPLMGRVLRRGREFSIRATALQPREQILVKPGERIPADGMVVEGSCQVDESAFTGESRPIDKNVGDRVAAGTVSHRGAITVAVEKAAAQSRLAMVLRLIHQAQRSRPAQQRLADVAAAWLTPLVIVCALLTLVGWGLLAPARWWSEGVSSAMSVLVVACPCAMGLAAPMAIVVGLGRAAQRGLLFRDATAVERLAAVRQFCFDKTGTLTLGRPKVVGVHPQPGITAGHVLGWASAVEAHSEHPWALAICAAAPSSSRAAMTAFAAEPGHGVQGVVEGHEVRVGRWAYVMQTTATSPPQPQTATVATGTTVVWVSRDRQLAGSIQLEDELRADAHAALTTLKRQGHLLWLLTGDGHEVAQQIATQLPLDAVHAELRPEEKLALLAGAKSATAMVGDGVNDAPALAVARCGIALATGTDAALATADVVLTAPQLMRIAEGWALARAIQRNISQNLWWAAGYNLMGIPLAAGVFLPWLGWRLTPLFAAVAMSVSSLAVIANALRLGRWRF